MSASTSTSNFHAHTNGPPGSPASPNAAFQNQQNLLQRSFIDLHRAQGLSVPMTPVSAHTNGAAEQPPGMLYSDFIRRWSDNEVARWLSEIKCANHAETFRNNDIRGDILLELDQSTLQEMGVKSIGDRLRIVNAVKLLRQKAASKTLAPAAPTPLPGRLNTTIVIPQPNAVDPSPTTRLRRLESGRPAPLQLNAGSNRNDLPRLVRGGDQPPDSAKTAASSRYHSSATTPSATTPVAPNNRTNLSNLPPIPRAQATPPRTAVRTGGRRTPTPNDAPPITNQPLPPAPTTATTPSGTNWSNTYHLPADPRPGNTGGGKTPAPRAPSPNTQTPPPRTVSRNVNTALASHGRNSSLGTTSSNPAARPPPRPSTGGSNSSHPYANAQSLLQPPTPQQNHNLSPIAEAFTTPSQSSTPSPPTNAYTVGRGPFNPAVVQGLNPSLDDLRKYIVKFILPEGGHSKISIADCKGGVEILEKVLRKMDKGVNRSGDNTMDRVLTDGGGLSVDGWSVYMEALGSHFLLLVSE